MALQYKIELAISGMVDGPPGGLPLGERLARLREHRAHMRAGTFSGSGIAHLSKPAPLAGRDGTGLVSPAFGGSIATVVVNARDGIVEVFAPHGLTWDGGQATQRWEMSMKDLSVQPEYLATVSVDVVQDLLVVVQLVQAAW